RVDYIKPTPDFHPSLSFDFDEAFDVIGEEVRHVQENVGLCEVNGFNRFEITGADRHSFLDRMFCGAVTKRDERVGLGYLLNDHGMVKGEATVANLPASDRGPARVWYGSAAASEYHDMDWLTEHLNADEDVQIRSLTNDHTILVLAGPNARDVLNACSREDWSKEAFPWLSARECFIGFAPAVVLGVSFSGELAYEIHVPNASLFAAYLTLREAGKDHDLKLFGARAVDAMRMEKGFMHWKADLLTEFDPFETGLDRFVKPEKDDFIGREALLKRMANGPTRKLVTLKIDSTKTPAHGGASLMQADTVVGTITSGDWGYRVGMNLAYAFVMPELAAVGSKMQLDLCGDLVDAEVITPSPYDADYSRMRA
ncbi:aminomethyltransferase family protein, partial [Rhodobacteraceae bacterium]|nr:aminomethyltransferase family protein [Paracoccaceae bacterium]